MSKNLGIFLILVILLPVVMSGNGCSGFNVTNTSLSSEANLSDAELLESGKVLFKNNCAGCHSMDPSVSTNKLNRNAAQIFASIAMVPQMQGLSRLTARDVDALVAALVYNPTASAPSEEMSGAHMPLGTRHFAASVLETVFLREGIVPTADDTTISTTINNLVRNQIAAFGGPCFRYDYYCPGGAAGGRDDVATNHFGMAMPLSNPMRAGYKVRSCEEVLQVPKAVANALANAQLTMTSPNSEASILALYNLFAPDQQASPEVTKALSDAYTAAKNRGLQNEDAWRFVLLPLCQSAIGERI